MALNKLKNEKSLIIFFIIASTGVLGLSIFFLFKSIERDELGGSFLTAMLIFISAYGLIVFIKRAIRYSLIRKIQKAVIVDNIYDISIIAQNLGKPEEKIEEEVNFLINNGYLPEFEVVADRIINPEQERARRDRATEELIKEKTQEQQKRQPQRRRTISEKCPNCGAKVKFSDDETECPYCGNSLKKA